MTVDEIIEKTVKPIAKEAFSDALEILQLIALLEAQNSNDVNMRLSKAGAGRAALVLRNAFIARLTLLIARCYAKPRKGDLHIRLAFDLIAKDKRLSAELSKRTSPAILKHAEDTWSLCRSDQRLQQIEHFRHKYTAHLGEPDEEIPIPTYKDLFDYARETTKVMQALVHLSGVNTHDLRDWNEEIKGSADEFWKPWTVDEK